MLAAIRPDAVNLPLFLHVLGAGLFVGALLAIAIGSALAGRAAGDAVSVRRFTLRTAIVGLLPAYLLMRVGAQWTEAQEDLPASVEDDAWITIGYIVADLGALLVLASVIVSAIGLRRTRDREGGGRGAARAVGIMAGVLILAALVAVWAMAAKPA